MKNIHSYNYIAQQLRRFFQEKKGFIEVPAQSRVSILAACEDPKTIAQFTMNNLHFPLPQTGQMWLEHELLQNPGIPGVFCLIASFRDEPNPIPGRHYRVFPMFDFEAHGDINTLRALETELLEYLGFEKPVSVLYNDMCEKYCVEKIEADQETSMWKEIGSSICLEKFPQRTSPFWNMKHIGNGIYNKIDVILYGMETIGSAERSSDVDEMRENFFTISDGGYADLLFTKFGKDRVIKELDEYLAMPMFPRFGGGIGVTRLERAMQLAGLLDFPSIQTFIPKYPFAQPVF
jgi:aspartyl/asparaginyl-tRNA synthetase